MKLENKFAPFFFLPPVRDPYDEWREVKDPAIREYAYYVNTYGDVFAGIYGHLLKWQTNHGGYQFVTLDGKEKYDYPGKGTRYQRKIHRLVMIAFNPVPGYEKLQVNHIDGNKLNNHISNLEWCTCKENVQHSINLGLRHFEKYGKRIDEDTALCIKDLLSKGYTHKQILEMVNHCCSIDVIDNISVGRSWRDL